MTNRSQLLIHCGILVLIALAGTITAQQTIVSPPDNVDTEGSLRGTAGGNPFRIQFLFSASDFESIPVGGAFLSGHAIRSDGSVTETTSSTTYVTYVLSTTNADRLFDAFDDNTGNDATQVYQGARTSSFPVATGDAPHPFGRPIEYDQMFFYDPATMGNLVMESFSVDGAAGPGTAPRDWEATGATTTIFADSPVAEFATDSVDALIVTQFTIVSRVMTGGDYDGNRVLDVGDLDLQANAIRRQDLTFDENDDGSVDGVDRRVWVTEYRGTWFGDANLDGKFDSTDLITIFTAGQFEDEIEDNSGWADGDWNGDGDFDSADLVIAFIDGGYEQGQRAASNAVPEPVSFPIFMVAMTGIAIIRRQVA